MEIFKKIFSSCTNFEKLDHDICEVLKISPRLPDDIKQEQNLEMDSDNKFEEKSDYQNEIATRHETLSERIDEQKSQMNNDTFKVPKNPPSLPDDIKQEQNSEMDSDTKLDANINSISDHQNLETAKTESISESVDTPCQEGTNWNDLPNEMKQMIISKMDYFTRLNLAQCSKSDFANVKILKIPIFSIGINGSVEEGNKPCISLAIWHNENSRNLFKIIEEDRLERKCRISIERGINGDKLLTKEVYQQENIQIIALKIIRWFLENSDHKLKRLNIGTDSPTLRYLFANHLHHINNFFVCAQNVRDILWWLERLGPLKFLTVHVMNPEKMTELIKQFDRQRCPSSIFAFSAGLSFSEEDFLKLNLAHIKMYMDVRSVLTTRSFNRFIQRWRRGEMKCDFRSMTVRNIRELDENVLLEGLDAEEWDDAFKRKRKQFYDIFVSHYKGEKSFQVRNIKGDMEATLNFSNYQINFIVTYKQSGRFSVPYTRISL